MSYNANFQFSVTREAGEDLSDYQYRFVTLESDKTIDLADSTSDYAFGVLQNAPESACAGNVVVAGETEIEAGETLSIGYFVGTDATGRAIQATSGNYARGIVLESAGAANDKAVIRLFDTANTVS